MRKGYCLIILALLLGCNKEHEQGREVSFYLTGAYSGEFPTKSSIAVSDAAAVLSSTLPSSSGLSLSIQSRTKSGRTYEASVGESVYMAYDSYTATGSWNGGYLMAVRGGKLYSRPSYSVSGDFTVTDASSTYPLSAHWLSSALIITPSEVSSVTISSASSGVDEILSRFTTVGTYGVLYVTGSGWTAAAPLSVILTPVDDVNYEPVTYNFTSSTLQSGRWYYLSPSAVEVTDGGFDISFPSWEQGN